MSEVNEPNAGDRQFFWTCKNCGITNIYNDNRCYNCGETKT